MISLEDILDPKLVKIMEPEGQRDVDCSLKDGVSGSGARLKILKQDLRLISSSSSSSLLPLHQQQV